MLAHLKAFLLLAETLRAAIDVDLLRRALPFANPFPSSYVEKVVDPNYQPALSQLVDDYLEANPTRNRELDLLPLFTHLDPERVRAKVEDALIKARPTFHYRLPDTRVSDPAWSLIVEWNRWVEVEHLAADASALRRLGDVYLDEARAVGLGRWPRRSTRGEQSDRPAADRCHLVARPRARDVVVQLDRPVAGRGA